MSLRNSQDALVETTIEIMDSLTEQLREKKLHAYADRMKQYHDDLAEAYIAERRHRMEMVAQKRA